MFWKIFGRTTLIGLCERRPVSTWELGSCVASSLVRDTKIVESSENGSKSLGSFLVFEQTCVS